LLDGREGESNAASPTPNPVIPFQVVSPATSIGLWLLLFGLYLAFLLIALWVHQDARMRRMNGLLWLAIVFGIPIGGLVAYLILRRERAI
jgi:hypothetical protein